MKSFFLLSFFALLSAPAFADYFGCELTVNERKVDGEAPYRGMEVEVELDGYTCAAQIIADRRVELQVTSSTGTRALSDGRFYEARGRLEESGNVVTCACGLR